MHSDVDVGEFVDVLNNSLDACKDALEAGDQTNQELVFGVGFLGELQKEVQELNNGQYKSTKSL